MTTWCGPMTGWGWVGMVALWGTVLAVAVWAVGRLFPGAPAPSAREQLDARLASGALDPAEYRRVREVLDGAERAGVETPGRVSG